MTKPLKVLFVEDSFMDTDELLHVLNVGGFDTEWQRVETALEMEAALGERPWDLVICDYYLPQFSSVKALDILHDKGLDIPFFIVSGIAQDEAVVASLKAGACDFVRKDCVARLVPAIERELLESANRRDKKIAQETLRATEERFRLMIETAVDYAMFMVDLSGTIITWNIGAERLFGYRFDEAIGRPLLLLTEEDAVDVTLRQGRWEGEKTGRRKDGTEFWIHATMILMRDAKGVRQGLSIFMRDIQAKKTAEAQRLALLAADAANQARRNFLAHISHEIRTPMNAVLGFASLVGDDDISTTERDSFVNTILRNGQEVVRLLDEILDLSKIEAGKFQIEPRACVWPDVLTDVVTSLQVKADAKGISLLVEKDESIPANITTDPHRLRQILVNLIGNAIKFTDQGEVRVRTVQLNDMGSHLLGFLVKDSGCGIEPTQQGRLFQPFVQVDESLTRKHAGTGLGLSLARELAKALGGDVILLDSSKDQGSTFLATVGGLPAVAAKDLNDAKILQGVRVLLADDGEDNQILVKRILSRLGASVDSVDDGDRAITEARLIDYDVIIMDVQMPVLNGIEATVRLRASGYMKPIIAFTAQTTKADRDRCFEVGCNDIMRKPISPKDLIAKVRTFARPLGKPLV